MLAYLQLEALEAQELMEALELMKEAQVLA